MHTQQLLAGMKIAAMLRQIGFRVRPMHRYGKYRHRPGVVAFVARKP